MVRCSGDAVAFEVVFGQAHRVGCGERRPAQGRLHQFQGVRQGQLRNLLLHLVSGGGDEQVSQRHHRHVVMPARPGPGFVIGHPEVAFAVLEELFDAPARAGDQSHRLQGRLLIGIGDVVLHFGILREAFANDEPDRRARRNLLQAGGRKVRLIKTRSQDVLPGLPAGSFDLAYIDGDHSAPAVLFDSVECWRLLRPSGLLIWDDYAGAREHPPARRPATAIDAFLACYAGRYEIAWRRWQLGARKIR